MGRAKSWHWDHFYKSDTMANRTHWPAICKYCVKHELGRLELEEQVSLDASSISHARSRDILIAEAQGIVKFTTGKLSVMNNHLLSCDYAPTQVRDLASKHKHPEGSDSDDVEVMSGPGKTQQAVKRSHSLMESDGPSQGHTDAHSKKQKAFTIITAKHTPFTQKTQTLFEDQLLSAWLSAGLAFNAIEDPEVRKLFNDFIPGATVPHRDQLSGTILKHAVSDLEHTLSSEAKGQLATLQCDGWRDVSRKHLVAFMYTVSREAHVTHIHDASDKCKTGKNLFQLMDKELEHLTSLGLTPIGVAGDAGSDERKARLLVLKKYPHLLIADCWVHQIALILGDYYKTNVTVALRMDTAIKVIQWFNNHSFALGLLNSEQRQMYTKTKALITPVVTRWTAQYCALSRLLETWKALQVTIIKHEDDLMASVGKKKNLISRAREVLRVCRDENWWKEITIIKTHIEPLAIAVNIAQGANTRCDQVVLVLGVGKAAAQDAVLSE
ncbi:hypothetical protein AX14_008056 [Amanita brunnescens Koide BX004]|nr:hypothetical protein AX14_008056 [Amanita brunnescens Koide BX004]